ncbi:MAG: Hydroxyethylthiazole kinase [Desulfovibrio sp.]
MFTPVPFTHAQAAPFLNALRARTPIVHCITNDVVQAFTANVLLAVGASPAMIVAEEEAAGFAAVADAVSLNVGTVQRMTARSMILAASSASKYGKPWVLDPVAVGILPYRAGVAAELLTHRPTAIRGNPSEILALAGKSSTAKGPDSRDTVADAREAAEEVARRYKCIVAMTGESDCITNGMETYTVHGGHANLTRVTGTGCALSAVVAACISCGKHDSLAATAAACLLMKTAGEKAGVHAGLGSFAVALLDALSLLTGETLQG